MEYTWYEVLNNSDELQQGDFIPECPIVVPPSGIVGEGEEVDVDIQLIDSIILSQSCDLAREGKVTNVLVCPYKSLKSFLDDLPPEKVVSRRAKKNTIENIKQGMLPPYHLLNKSEGIDFLSDYQVVDFRNVYAVNFHALKGVVSRHDTRVRLLPPYREHLSQAFARFLMRVGLPQDFKIEGYF